LVRLEGNRWKQVGKDWNFPGSSAQTLFLDRDGTLWVATEDTIVFLPAGSRTFQPTGLLTGQVFQIARAPNGKLWMAETTRSVRPIPLGDKRLPSDETEIRVGSTGILFDREGALWVTTIGDGIRRVANPERLSGKPGRFSSAADSFTAKSGLTDDVATPILEDVEGNIWVGTQNGLDRFRETNLVPIALPIPPRRPHIAAGDGGDLWVQGLNLWVRVQGGRTKTIRYALSADDANEIVVAYRGPTGAMWWISRRNVYRLEGESFKRFPLPEELTKSSVYRGITVTEDRSGTLWAAAAAGAGLFNMKGGVWQRFETPPDLAKSSPEAAFTDEMGHLWFGYEGGRIIRLDVDRKNLDIISSDSHSPVGSVRAIQGRDRQIWVGGDEGLAFFDGSRFQSLVPEDAATLGPVWAIEETSDGSLWLCAVRGVVHVAAQEVARFLSNPSYRVRYELFDSLDGLPGTFQNRLSAKEVQGTDGRLWFAASNGIARLDPARISRNVLPPPVVIRSLITEGKHYPYWTSTTVPPLTRNLQIQFTALSLSIPERVHFKYMLEGYDKGWQDGGTLREATYTNLGPRKYRFRVIACNNDGVWNEIGATLNFSVTPAWYQTIWFRSVCAAGFALLLWGFYQLRLRQLARQFNIRMEERVNERTRIARELHDTLLQSFQGLLLVLQSGINLLPDRPEEARARERLQGAIDQAEQAITEGRDAVQGLRSSTTMQSSDLTSALNTLGAELSTVGGNESPPAFHVEVEGKARELKPVPRDEVYRIVGEALRNAFRHAQAHRVEVAIRYDEQGLTVRVRDDGKGIRPETLEAKGRAGHWGLPGMRERASKIGAQLELWSRPEAGTEMELKISAATAYQSRRAWGNWFSSRRSSNNTQA